MSEERTYTIAQIEQAIKYQKKFKVKHPMKEEPIDGMFPDYIETIEPGMLLRNLKLFSDDALNGFKNRSK